MTTGGISNTTVDAMISGQKWDLSATETLSWSYYETSGVTYSYAFDSSAGVTAGNSIINSAGDTVIVKEMMDLWDQAAGFTLEHVIETSSAGGTVVGEIRCGKQNQSGAQAGYAALVHFLEQLRDQEMRGLPTIMDTRSSEAIIIGQHFFMRLVTDWIKSSIRTFAKWCNTRSK